MAGMREGSQTKKKKVDKRRGTEAIRKKKRGWHLRLG